MANVARLRELYRKNVYEILGEDTLESNLKPHKKNTSLSIMENVTRLRELYRKPVYELVGEDVLARTLKPRKKHASRSIMKNDKKVRFAVPMGPVSPVLPGRGRTLTNFGIGIARSMFEKKPVELLNGDSFILHSSKPSLVGKKRALPEASPRAPRKVTKSRKSITRREMAASLFSGPVEPTPLGFNVNDLLPKYEKVQSSEVPTLSSKLVSSKSKNESRAASSSSKTSRGVKSKDAVKPSPSRSAPVVKSRKTRDSASKGSADSVRNSKRKRGSERSRDTKEVSRGSWSRDEIIEKAEKKRRRSQADADEEIIEPVKRVRDISQNESVLRVQSRDKKNFSDKPAKELRKVDHENYAQETRRLLLAPRTTAILRSKPVSPNVSGTTKAESAENGATSTKELSTIANGGVSKNDSPPSAFLCANQARVVYLKLKERLEEYWCQKKYDDFERDALKAAEACFEWAIAVERDMRGRERHVRLNEKSRMEGIKPVQEHYRYLVHKVKDNFVKKLESINRKRGVDTLKRIVNKARLRISLLGSLWSSEHTTGLRKLKGKLEMNRIHEVDEEDLRLLRSVVGEFSDQRELLSCISSDTGFGTQEPGTEASLR